MNYFQNNISMHANHINMMEKKVHFPEGIHVYKEESRDIFRRI